MTLFARRLSIYIYTALAATPLWCGPAQGAPPAAEPLRVAICHRPPGNSGNAHTLFVSPDAVDAHLAHGDSLGPCGAMESQPGLDTTPIQTSNTDTTNPSIAVDGSAEATLDFTAGMSSGDLIDGISLTTTITTLSPTTSSTAPTSEILTTAVQEIQTVGSATDSVYILIYGVPSVIYAPAGASITITGRAIYSTGNAVVSTDKNHASASLYQSNIRTFTYSALSAEGRFAFPPIAAPSDTTYYTLAVYDLYGYPVALRSIVRFKIVPLPASDAVSSPTTASSGTGGSTSGGGDGGTTSSGSISISGVSTTIAENGWTANGFAETIIESAIVIGGVTLEADPSVTAISTLIPTEMSATTQQTPVPISSTPDTPPGATESSIEIPLVTSESSVNGVLVSNEGAGDGESSIQNQTTTESAGADSIASPAQSIAVTETETVEETARLENDAPTVTSTTTSPQTSLASSEGGASSLFELVAEPMGTGAGVHGSSIQWKDYDHDGDIDLAVSGWDGSRARMVVYGNEGGGHFTKAAEPMGVDAGLLFSSIDWGDYDNDGDPDLAVSGAVSIAPRQLRLILFRNDGGVLTKAAEPMGPDLGVFHSSIDWGDYDGDGDLDLAVSGFDEAIRCRLILYRNEGGGTFVKAAEPMGVNMGLMASSIQWGDYDRDGDPDLVVAGGESYDGGNLRPRLIVFQNNGGVLTMQQEPMGMLKGVYYGAVDWEDYDGDGDPDLLVSGIDGGPIAPYRHRLIVYRNDNGEFIQADEPMGTLMGTGECSLDWGDYDNDGDLDFAVTGDTAPATALVALRLIIYRNDGGRFVRAVQPMGVDSGLYYSPSIQWGDYDNDGDLDLAVSGNDRKRPRLLLFRNNLGASSTTPVESAGSDSRTGSEQEQVSAADRPESQGVSTPEPVSAAVEPSESLPIDAVAAIISDTPAAVVMPETYAMTGPDTAAPAPQDTTLPGMIAMPPSDTTLTAISEIPPADSMSVAAGQQPVEWLPPPSSLTAICHRPPGNPDKSRTIFVSSHAVKAHLAHGDIVGLCANENVAPSQATGTVTAGKTSLARSPLPEGKERWSLKVEIKHDGIRPSFTTLTKKLPPGTHRIREAKLPGGRIELIARPDGLYLQLTDIPMEPTDTAELEIMLDMDMAALSNDQREKTGDVWKEAPGVEEKPADALPEPERRVQGKISGTPTDVDIAIFDVTQSPPRKLASISPDSAGVFEFGVIPDGVREIVVRIEKPNSIPEFRRVTLGEEKTIHFLGTLEPESLSAREDVDEIRSRVDRPDERQEFSRGEGSSRSRIDIPAEAVGRKFYLVMREPKNLAEIEAAAKARGERLLSATEIVLIDEETGEEIHNGFKKRIRIAFSLADLKAREGAKVSHYDPANKKLDDVSSAVDPEKGEVAADVEHFSIYASLGVPAAAAAPTFTDFSQLLVYPNPYEARYGTDRVFFENIPAGAELTIYTIGGQIVHKIINDGAADLNGSTRGTSAAAHIGWGLTNRHGRNVASAIYLFVLRDAVGNVKNGRVAVVR